MVCLYNNGQFTCLKIAISTCDDCGIPLCEDHAYLNNGVQCLDCIENSIDSDYDNYFADMYKAQNYFKGNLELCNIPT